MAIIDLVTVADQDSGVFSALESETVFQIAFNQRYAVDKYDTDGVTVITAREQVDDGIAALSTVQRQTVRAYLEYLGETGVDTFKKRGGQDGIDFDPVRDADSAERAICRMVLNLVDPIGSGGPYFA